MDSHSTWGGLVPLWILGAPFVAAIFALMSSPKPVPRASRAHDDAARHPDPRAPYTPASTTTGLSAGRL